MVNPSFGAGTAARCRGRESKLVFPPFVAVLLLTWIGRALPPAERTRLRKVYEGQSSVWGGRVPPLGTSRQDGEPRQTRPQIVLIACFAPSPWRGRVGGGGKKPQPFPARGREQDLLQVMTMLPEMTPAGSRALVAARVGAARLGTGAVAPLHLPAGLVGLAT